MVKRHKYNKMKLIKLEEKRMGCDRFRFNLQLLITSLELFSK